MTQDTSAKKDTQRLQRAIVDGLEDVKAQDIQVYNTEHLSPLFERVIVASGTSNRQTKALAASVRDSVREAGFPKPRVEGEENGEWIIVDCGPAVAHIMQPAIRQYYHLEEIWGEKPVRLKGPAAKAAAAAAAKKAAPEGASAKRTRAAGTDTAGKSPGRKAAAKSAGGEGVARRTPAKASAKTSGKVAAKTAAKTPAKKSAGGTSRAPARSAATTARKTSTTAAKKTARKSTASRKA